MTALEAFAAGLGEESDTVLISSLLGRLARVTPAATALCEGVAAVCPTGRPSGWWCERRGRMIGACQACLT